MGSTESSGGLNSSGAILKEDLGLKIRLNLTRKSKNPKVKSPSKILLAARVATMAEVDVALVSAILII